jgi:TRAP-type C4-dicarboxylate transport system permease small subunit
VVFIGGALVTRKRAHISVEVLSHILKPGPLRTAVRAAVDLVTLGFFGLLAYFSVTIIERMHYQRMTVIDLPMSYVYAGVLIGCFMMFARQAWNTWKSARNGWREDAP